MSVAKITEITSTSERSFDEAVQDGIERAGKTLHGITCIVFVDGAGVSRRHCSLQWRAPASRRLCRS